MGLLAGLVLLVALLAWLIRRGSGVAAAPTTWEDVVEPVDGAELDAAELEV